ncbi:MFS general substrate transporter [Wallemia mellicola CBS 633.66]|uniref:MFS general substrate transporter n=1 Tax=Wallemia mellicola (strain ATCC MYA-4683 / CBS 633.66) TaxID=671144 RepID=I4Y7I9_WALMC|nr:MFS general substrate transporter [Wallemia mellicola CBS 633.66]EIM19931.1 MFS general substrate transporter [Wallemia mellicola CBS 633.66]|eukprot:XP_006960070.1 MFS general substrate transporter [Wallemia mellicola CBS 633.66]
MNEKQVKRFQDIGDGSDQSGKTIGSNYGDTPNEMYFEKKTGSGKIVLTEDAAPEVTGFAFSRRKKWTILTVIVIIQLSMNYNGAVYANSVSGMSESFSISEQAARTGQMILLITYAFGCELWAPWSEEFGRWPILQLSLFLTNCWTLLQCLAPNIGSMIVGRGLAGLSMAGGSVTLAMVADMFSVEAQQYGLAYVVWSSVAAATLGPILGGFIRVFAQPGPSWRWIFWTQLIFGGFAQLLHWSIPETRTTILLDREAKRRRKEAAKEGKELNIWGPSEVSEGISVKEVLTIWYRPFEMFVREPIVLSCSMLSGFSDMLIFIFLDSFTPVFSQWGFTPWQTGLCFLSILVSYFIAWASFLPFFRSAEKRRKRGLYVSPEDRLYWLLYLAPLEAIGLFGFAWTSMGPDHNHWFGPIFFAALIGIANYAIYMATIDYMVAAYGPYSASATGGNALARDFLSGVAAMFSNPFYEHFPKYTLEYPTTILACIAIALIVPIHLLYFYGPEVRKRSKFAQLLAGERETTDLRHQVRDEKANISKHIEVAA